MQLQQVEEQLQEKDSLIQSLQERIEHLESSATKHDDLLHKLNEVLD
jgi:prefoldin subunit 5